jgi:DNA-binding NtrC family response regulator
VSLDSVEIVFLKRRALIVEDDFLIPTDLEETLNRAGFGEVRLTGDMQEAIDLVQTENWDAVILDGNLHGVIAEPVALALLARDIPFVVVTGYGKGRLPPSFDGGAILQKPIREQHSLPCFSTSWKKLDELRDFKGTDPGAMGERCS